MAKKRTTAKTPPPEEPKPVEEPKAAPKAAPKPRDVVAALYALEAEIAEAVTRYAQMPDGTGTLVSAGLSQVAGGITTLRQNEKTAEHLVRPEPRTSGGRSEDGSAN